jgi:hypothetical protein
VHSFHYRKVVLNNSQEFGAPKTFRPTYEYNYTPDSQRKIYPWGSLCWHPTNFFSCEEIPRLLTDPESSLGLQQPATGLALSPINPCHTLITYLFHIHFNIILRFMRTYRKSYLMIKIVYEFLISSRVLGVQA